MREFLDFIKEEWSTIKSAPVTFIILLIIAFGGAFYIINWRYEGIIQTKDERIGSCKDRLEAKDALLLEYRERLHLVSTDETIYFKLSNIELKKKSFKLISQVRDWLEEEKEKQRLLLERQFELAVSQSSSEKKQKEIRNQEISDIIKASNERMAYYNKEFKAKTILMRDELISRLPQGGRGRLNYSHYESPVNLLMIDSIVTDLEKLARSLPDKGIEGEQN